MNHGGDLAAAEARFGRPAEQWLDLSTGINPNAYPVPSIDPALFQSLPQATGEAKLLAAAAAYFRAAPEAALTAAPGTQALIQWLPRLRAESRIGVLGPTYGEHEICWRAAGHTVEILTELPVHPAVDVCVVVNPNSPDGRRHDAEALQSLARQLAEKGGWLVVDESFADPHPELSLTGSAGADGLILLRSFGKFFGLAGLRLGFAMGDTSIVEPIRGAIGPWAVSGPAMEIGGRAMRDSEWIAATRATLRALAERLDRMLTDHGLAVIGGTDLFRLVEHADAKDLFRRLAERGILTRAFDFRDDWLRFGFPGGDADFERLDAGLSA
jgi:cobalamin biosynthetic protein CobC